MIAAAMGGEPFKWPVGTYVNNTRFSHIMMAMETEVGKDGTICIPVKGTPQEEKELEESYKHLCKLRDEVIYLGIMPPIAEWGKLNPALDKPSC